MLNPDPEVNPWIGDIRSGYFEEGEPYDPAAAWQRLSEAAVEAVIKKQGIELPIGLPLDLAQDISSVSVHEDYQGKHGNEESISLLLYHTCMHFALANGVKHLLTIQDLKPLANLQQYGNIFDTFPGLEARAYGGPDPTLPAFTILTESERRMRNAGWGEVFVDGQGLDTDAVLMKDYSRIIDLTRLP